jgi:AraC-like DNA-binding protein
MPLFIDYHQFDAVTIENVKEAHMADKAVQDDYGVKYHQFWVNENAGTVFCLIEAPDRETCELVHKLAHGNVACAITEVEQGFYKLAMGPHTVKSDGGLVTYHSGEADLGYRSMLVVSIRGVTTAKDSSNLENLLLPNWARKMVLDNFGKFNARVIPWEIDDSLIAAFDDASQAVQCSILLQEKLLKSENQKPNIIFKIGLATAQPVTADGDFFNETLKLSHRLSNAACDNQILISSLTGKLAHVGPDTDPEHLKVVTPSEEKLLSDLINTLESGLFEDKKDIRCICRNIGISRPQLYRKVKTITGRSPNYFIRDLRLNKARTLLQQKSGNVSEVAMEVGYNNLSYFSKCFTEKFGFKPSAI